LETLRLAAALVELAELAGWAELAAVEPEDLAAVETLAGSRAKARSRRQKLKTWASIRVMAIGLKNSRLIQQKSQASLFELFF
jgi:hypothetical protein